ncbi:MAG: TIGR03862 family flavoprotein [Hyphomicrobiaceae bacterium]
MKRVIVIGGGPAGLMAADVIATAFGSGSGSVRVTLYERMPSVGRKLLMAGRGGLNLTHGEPLEMLLGRYGDARAFMDGVVGAFPPAALRAMAESLGQDTFVGSSGRVFPRAMKASPLLRAWLARLAGRGVEFRTRHTFVGFDEAGAALIAEKDEPALPVAADAVVLALGGGNWPRLGSRGDWVPWLRQLGVAVHALQPANAGVKVAWSEHFRDRFAGTPLKRIAVTIGNRRSRGEAVVTRDGLEGGAIYALTPAVRHELAKGAATMLSVDLRPDLDHAELVARLSRARGKQSVSAWLKKTLRLAPVAIGLVRDSAQNVLPKDPEGLARIIKSVMLPVSGTGSLDRAISSAGGVVLGEVAAEMMVKSRPGLFVAGEMLDWEAPTGGYLLQGCFATGHAAGRGVLGYLGLVPSAPVPKVLASGASE